MADTTESPTTTDISKTEATPDPNPSPDKNAIPEAYMTAVIWIIVIIMIFSFIGNTLALTSLCRNRKSVYPWFFNLAMSDFLKTIFCMPYSIYLAETQYVIDPLALDGGATCQVFGYIFHMTLMMGLISNMCVALDRVHATYFPFHYSNNQKKFLPQYMIVVTWICVALISGLPFYLQTGSESMPAFKPLPWMPIQCMFDISDARFMQDKTRAEADIYRILYYSILYLVPILVIVTSTCLVLKKLLPKILAERKLYKGTMNSVMNSVIMANSTAITEDPGLTTAVEDNQLSTFNGGGPSSPKSKKRSKFSIDILLKLHTGSKQVNNKTHVKRNQWRAIQTMMIVSIAFVLCHVVHILYWVFYQNLFDPILQKMAVQEISPLEFNALFWVSTGQIIVVYLDAAVNVIVYYSRCTLIKESMLDSARAIFTFIISPLLLLMRKTTI